MDRIIKITLGLFLVILVVFVAFGWYGHYVEQRYRNSLVSTYTYNLTISASEELTNVTFIIPVPVNETGDSRVTEHYSLRQVSGLPQEWRTTLLSSNKGTMIKITAPVFTQSTTELELELPVEGPIETRSPVEKGVLYRPVQDLEIVECPVTAGQGATCYQYKSSIYATYDSSPQARVEISSTMIAKNEWNIFGTASNEYSNSIAITIVGDHRRWAATTGELATGIGSYEIPEI